MKTRHILLIALAITASAWAQTPPAPAGNDAAPEDAAALNQQSIERLRQKDTLGAIELAEKATRLDPAKADYFAQLGMAYGQRMGEIGFMQQAMISGKLKKAFARAVELDPDNVAGLIGMSRFYSGAPEIAGGSLEKATEFATRVRKLNPFLGAIELGNIATKDEKYADALAHYEAAAKLNPGHAGVQNACGRTLAKLGRKDEARARFEAALKLNPALESARKALAELDTPAN